MAEPTGYLDAIAAVRDKEDVEAMEPLRDSE